MNKTNNLANNTILLAIGTFLNKGLQFVMIPLFSRWLTTEDYGRYDLFATYVTLMIPIVTLACSEAVFRYGVEKDSVEDKRPYITNGLAIVLTNSLIMGVIVIFIKFFFNWNLAVPFFFMAFGEILNNYLQGYMRSTRRLNIYSFCTAFSTLCIFGASTVFVLLLDMGLSGLVWGYAAGFLAGDLAIILFTGYSRYVDCGSLSFSRVKEIVRYSYGLIPNNISWWIINVSDRSIINLFLGASYNGIYAIACKIPNFASAIFSVFSISWQESATDMVDSEERDAYYNKILNQMCRLLIPLCGGIVACNFIFFNWIFDSKYSTGYPYVPILVTSVIFGSLSQFFGGIQISLKRPKANGATTMVGAAVNVLVHLCLINYVGLYAAVLSTIISNIVITFARVYLLRKCISFKIDRSIFAVIFSYAVIVMFTYLNISIVFNLTILVFAGLVFLAFNMSIVKSVLIKLGFGKVIRK